MTNPRRSELIKLFLNQNAHPDLAELYTNELEVQVQVAQDNGEPVEGSYMGKNWRGWTDGIQTWKNFRIPSKAWTEPQDNDYPINFDLSAHVEGIGLTGWNWVKKKSLWVAYDFDAIIGHSDRHSKKLTPEELEDIKEKISGIDYVTLRYSTGGLGFHVYVFIDQENLITSNHNEHMALARAILNQLSIEANFDFKSKVDAHGAVMWIWHRKLATSHDGRGLQLIKKGNKLKEIPPNWTDHLDVVKGKRRRILPFFIKESNNPKENQDLFEELTGQRIHVPLDHEHKRLIDWIKDNIPGGSWWDEDHHMLITHTYTLKLAHEALRLKGIYRTIATGSIQGDYNCFLCPLYEGVWVVRRYTPGTGEDPTWEQDGETFTHCYFNRVPTFEIACKAFNGVEKANGGFVFEDGNIAKKVLACLGSDIIIPDKLLFRQITLRKHKDNKVIVEITKTNEDTAIPNEWVVEGKTLRRVIRLLNQNNSNITDAPNYDKYIRHVVTEEKSYGWVVRTSEHVWKEEPLEHIKLALKGPFSLKPSELEKVIGNAVLNPWKIVNLPFEDEFLPNRRWNKNAVQLTYERSQDLDNINIDKWMSIFNHLGKGLDQAVSHDPWCIANNINKGSDFLLLWTARLFQHPNEPLPYLFFWSEEQETGKSTFHEALSLLMTKSGYMNVNSALEPGQLFNGELRNAILCVIEEKDLTQSKKGSNIVYNRIKEWLTAKELLIHEKGKTPYLIPNTTHFVHCSNNRQSCPIFPGDRRIIVIYVEPISQFEMIPRSKLFEQLQQEAPDFLAFILNLELPDSNERLYLPILSTEDKMISEEQNMTPLELYIKNHCFYAPGEMILWSKFYEDFCEKTDAHYLEVWTKTYTGRHLPHQFPKGRSSKDPNFYVGNISWERPVDLSKPKLICIDNKLVLNRTKEEERNGTFNPNKEHLQQSE